MEKISFELGEEYLGGSHFLANTTGVGTLVSVVYSNAVTVAGVILIFLLIFAGSKMQANWENPDAVKEGQKIITYALMGFVAVVAAWYLIRLLEATFGVTIVGVNVG